MIRILFVVLSCMITGLSFAKETNKKSIFFILHQRNKGFISMYNELKKRGHDVKIVVLPMLGSRYTDSKKDLLTQFLSKMDKKDIIFPCHANGVKCESIEKYKPDYVVVINPYSTSSQNISHLFDNQYLAKFSKVLYIPYGPELWDLDLTKNIKLPKIFYKVLADSDLTKRIFIKKHGFRDEEIIVVGYQNYKDLRDEMSLPRERKKETILWAPRWFLKFTGREMNEPGSTFLSYRDFFYNFAKENPNVNLIIRGHPNLYKELSFSKFMTHSQTIEMLKRFESLPNVEVIYPHELPLTYEQRDIIESDIVITDTTSLMTNFFLADKPMIYLSNGFDTHFNTPEFQDMAMFMRFAYSPRDILKEISALRSSGYAVTQRCAPNTPKPCTLGGLKQYMSNKFGPGNIVKSHRVDKSKLIQAIDPVENPAKAIADFIDND